MLVANLKMISVGKFAEWNNKKRLIRKISLNLDSTSKKKQKKKQTYRHFTLNTYRHKEFIGATL